MILAGEKWRAGRVSLAGLFLLFFSLGPCSLPAQMSQSNQAQPQSQDEIAAVPNRPTFATTAEAVQRGVFEIEYGLEAAQGHQNINGLLKFGLFKNLELRFANNPIERNSGIAGTGDSVRKRTRRLTISINIRLAARTGRRCEIGRHGLNVSLLRRRHLRADNEKRSWCSGGGSNCI